MRSLGHFLRWKIGLAQAETQTTPAERDCLARMAEGLSRVVEVGVWHGVTTRRLRAAMAPTGTLWAVDPYPRGRLGVSLPRRIALREVGSAGGAAVEWVRTTGVEAARLYGAAGEPPVELVFIDGDHSFEGLRADWEAWSLLVAPRGCIALHDSRSWGGRRIDDAGSAVFTREVVLRDPRWQVEEEVDSLTVVRRA
jgi:predicted O-methyltransferase YrrM